MWTRVFNNLDIIITGIIITALIIALIYFMNKE